MSTFKKMVLCGCQPVLAPLQWPLGMPKHHYDGGITTAVMQFFNFIKYFLVFNFYKHFQNFTKPIFNFSQMWVLTKSSPICYFFQNSKHLFVQGDTKSHIECYMFDHSNCQLRYFLIKKNYIISLIETKLKLNSRCFRISLENICRKILFTFI